jgi:hypothetical protein
MPARQRGSTYRLADGRWGYRYYENGRQRRVSPFPTRTAALDHFRDVVEPRLRGETTSLPDLTFAELAERFLDRHAGVRSPRTIRTLRERLVRPLAAFGDVPLSELERRSGEVADFAAGLPPRFRYSVMSAFRQTLRAGVRWGYLASNPAELAGPNPQPPARPIRAYTPAELAALDKELGLHYGPIVPFAAATGLRPSEWAGLQRSDVDRQRRLLRVGVRPVEGSRRPRARSVRCRSLRPGSTRSTGSRLASTPAGCSPRRPAGRCTWTTSAGASGARPSRPRASGSQPASTTCARPSPRMPSPAASRCTSSPA